MEFLLMSVLVIGRCLNLSVSGMDGSFCQARHIGVHPLMTLLVQLQLAVVVLGKSQKVGVAVSAREVVATTIFLEANTGGAEGRE